jgi:hypothetical protein
MNCRNSLNYAGAGDDNMDFSVDSNIDIMAGIDVGQILGFSEEFMNQTQNPPANF